MNLKKWTPVKKIMTNKFCIGFNTYQDYFKDDSLDDELFPTGYDINKTYSEEGKYFIVNRSLKVKLKDNVLYVKAKYGLKNGNIFTEILAIKGDFVLYFGFKK
jgi:hypothetical protein